MNSMVTLSNLSTQDVIDMSNGLSKCMNSDNIVEILLGDIIIECHLASFNITNNNSDQTKKPNSEATLTLITKNITEIK